MGDHAVLFPVATMPLADTGFRAKIIGAYALARDLDKRDELNHALFCSRGFLQDTRCATYCTLNYFYYGKPKRPSHLADAQEIGLGLSWPQLFGNNSIVPNYYVASIWPSKSNSLISGISGFIHVFGLAYDLAVPNLRPDGRPQPLRFYGDIAYDDGFCGVDHDWSHVAPGVGTSLEVAGVSITPSLNYQISTDDSVNTENELWARVNFNQSF